MVVWGNKNSRMEPTRSNNSGKKGEGMGMSGER